MSILTLYVTENAWKELHSEKKIWMALAQLAWLKKKKCFWNLYSWFSDFRCCLAKKILLPFKSRNISSCFHWQCFLDLLIIGDMIGGSRSYLQRRQNLSKSIFIFCFGFCNEKVWRKSRCRKKKDQQLMFCRGRRQPIDLFSKKKQNSKIRGKIENYAKHF